MSQATTRAEGTGAGIGSARTGSPRTATPPLWALYLATGAMAGGLLAAFPLYPTFQDRYGVSTTAIGVVGMVGFATAVIAELFLAPLADRSAGAAARQARWCMLAMSAGLLLPALAPGLGSLIAQRALAGMAFGAFLPAVSALVLAGRTEDAGEKLGKVMSAELAGLSIVPLGASLLLAVVGPMWTLLIATIPTLVALPFVRVDPDQPVDPAERSSPSASRPAGVRRGVAWDLLRHKPMVHGILLTVAFMVPIGAYDSIWPIFMDDLGAGPIRLGISYTLFAIPFALVAPWAGRRADRAGPWRTARAGFAILLPMVAGYAVITNANVVIGMGFLESTGQAIAAVAASSAVARAAGGGRIASGEGLARAIGSTGAGLVALAAGPVYGGLGAVWLFGGAVAVVLALLVAAWATRAASPPRTRRDGDLRQPCIDGGWPQSPSMISTIN